MLFLVYRQFYFPSILCVCIFFISSFKPYCAGFVLPLKLIIYMIVFIQSDYLDLFKK